MQLNRYYTIKYENNNPTVIDLKSVDIIVFNNTSIDFSIHGQPWTVNVEVTKELINELTKNWIIAREK